ncbi:MAG: NAD-dependent epimerase/dehydratase family protein [Chloroflexi bacterium]|nr:NAD-dependent epimerase/dehydratase family protein [Chloroflexota bacterium]
MNRQDGPFSYQRVLITGGAGFIGSHVVQRMLATAAEVAVVDNLSFGQKDWPPSTHERLHFITADIRDTSTLAQHFQAFRPDAVIHLAAIHFIPYCNQHPTEAADVNIMGTQQVLRCCELVQPRAVFIASTAAVYPIRDEANSEEMSTGPTDIYGISKLTDEWLAELFHRRTGLRTIIGRFFNAYGPNETNPHVIPEIVRQLLAGQRQLVLGDIRPQRDFIHVTDLVRAVELLLQAPEPDFGIFNIGTGVEYSVAEILRICEQILGETIQVIPDPARFRKVERMHLRADSHKLQQLTAWQPQVDMRSGLQELLLGDRS